MTRTALNLTPDLHTYAQAHSTTEDGLLAELAAETQRLFPDRTSMQIGADQGVFMTMLTRVMGARDVVEIGTFTGYSTICLARGIAPGGSVLACDVSPEWTSVAQQYWQRAGLGDRISLRLAPALDTLRSLSGEPTFDLAFVDADKENYIPYWEELLPRMRAGGVVLADNTLWRGEVLAPDSPDSPAAYIHSFNEHVHSDDRVETVVLTIGDGLTLSRVRSRD
ncbi:class I SAM-dependent methyltransferase [Lipingzhangella sp. LS1_29]|uniref:Class I SAM-dependent methyltransferase n=1 Tax=Lipingzhangella rawalii TaxID=2055835 RepID=A0ABU2H2N6_9ACTN|nr:class I SAM-dependent methyltransferase [Lipingzhangella rawalii]MDS1269561.1 class I SAM-dependent methyltransferase [Lipingzhangella rawalii]